MKVDIDNDVIMPCIIGISAIVITIFHSFYITKAEHNQIIERLVDEANTGFQETAVANKELDAVTKELQSYRTTAYELEHKLGASHTQAVQVIKAAEVYNLDPKH